MKTLEKTKQFFRLWHIGIQRRKVDDVPVRILRFQECIHSIKVKCTIDKNGFCISAFSKSRNEMPISRIEDRSHEIRIEGFYQDITVCRGS